MSESRSSGGSIFPSLLLTLFIGLKLAGVGPVANWSWWWVLSPAWIPLALVLVFMLGVFALAAIVGLAEWWRR